MSTEASRQSGADSVDEVTSTLNGLVQTCKDGENGFKVAAEALATGRDEAAIIAECERGEDVAVRAYDQALRSELPADLRALVERQFLKVKDAHDQIRSLEQIHSRHR